MRLTKITLRSTLLDLCLVLGGGGGRPLLLHLPQDEGGGGESRGGGGQTRGLSLPPQVSQGR